MGWRKRGTGGSFYSPEKRGVLGADEANRGGGGTVPGADSAESQSTPGRRRLTSGVHTQRERKKEKESAARAGPGEEKGTGPAPKKEKKKRKEAGRAKRLGPAPGKKKKKEEEEKE